MPLEAEMPAVQPSPPDVFVRPSTPQEEASQPNLSESNESEIFDLEPV